MLPAIIVNIAKEYASFDSESKSAVWATIIRNLFDSGIYVMFTLIPSATNTGISGDSIEGMAQQVLHSGVNGLSILFACYTLLQYQAGFIGKVMMVCAYDRDSLISTLRGGAGVR